MKTVAMIVFLAVVSGLEAQHVPDWENQHVTGINKLQPRASFVTFGKETAKFTIEESGRYVSLNGNWGFLWEKVPAAVPEGFYLPDFTIAGRFAFRFRRTGSCRVMVSPFILTGLTNLPIPGHLLPI